MITVFYDGTCGLCHRTVQFLIRQDPQGRLFRYAPLQGETAANRLGDFGDLPDSVVVWTADERVFTRGDAAIHLGHALGGFWWLLSFLFGILPRFMRDWLYDAIAARRHRWFGTAETSCPLLPPEQRAFFLP